MPLFSVPTRAGKDADRSIARKSKSTVRKTAIVHGSGLLSQIESIRTVVNENLHKYANQYQIITDVDTLKKYIMSANEQGMIAIDTETTGLNPMVDKIVGLCIYAPKQKAAYVPINHVSYITGVRVDEQLTERDVAECMKSLTAKVIMFNAKFDIRVIANQLGVDVNCWWDCYLASRVMNENEEHKGLKALHQKYVLDDADDEFSFGALFKGVSADKIPVDTFYLYAAHDALITFELYQFQSEWLRYDHPREDMRSLAHVFLDIEMPCVSVVAKMEDTGIELDKAYAKELEVRYTKKLDSITEKFVALLENKSELINRYRIEHPQIKLESPINIASPSQVAVLIYDILMVPSVDKKTPRGTGEAILKKIKDKDVDPLVNSIVDTILEYREVAKLLSTYIVKLPNCVGADGRVHCSFNQYGADTGRFSSSDPNLQNIPSHNKDIRKMFKASDGYVLMSSDYSQQEPKVMTQMCGDEKMIQAYREGKDLYAEIASLSFNTTYENCLEFRPDGTTNPEGKARRSQAKSILLGVLYGRGVPSIAEQLGTTTDRAQAIKDSVFKGFPAIPKFEQDSLEMAYEKGYVTTLWGRKRRLPDLQLPEFEYKWSVDVNARDNNTGSADVGDGEAEVPADTCRRYERMLRNSRPWNYRKVFEKANAEGIWIIDNRSKIADAERQCVNARIQGSAADMSKLAMIKVGTDQRLKELGFRLLIPVHDELIAECPEENVKECSERFAKLMSEAAEGKLTIPINCDVEITKRWYGEKINVIE